MMMGRRRISRAPDTVRQSPLQPCRRSMTGVFRNHGALRRIMEVSMNHEEYPLNVATPAPFTYVTRGTSPASPLQRERALKATHYNEFAFPAGMLTVDMLSDSGTTAMTDVQWSAMFLGDESYGRNKGLLRPAGRPARLLRARQRSEARHRSRPHELQGHRPHDGRAVSVRI